MSAAKTRPSCPPWCAEHIQAAPRIHLGEPRNVRVSKFREISVQLVGSDMPPSLYVDALEIDLGSVTRLSMLVRALGHQDLAAAIEELAARAAGRDGAR